MKLSPLEEYGLRCLVHMARKGAGASVTINELSDAQGISMHNVAKIMRLLRRKQFVVSERGHNGGYRLAQPSDRIVLGEVLAVLGGRLVEDDFCARYSTDSPFCILSDNCTVHSFWSSLQGVIDNVVYNTTIADFVPGIQHQAGNLVQLGAARKTPVPAAEVVS